MAVLRPDGKGKRQAEREAKRLQREAEAERDRARHEKERCRLRPATCPNAGCGAVVAFERLRDHVANFCEDPYFVARRRMIRKYRAIRKYGRPWAATPDSDDGESGGDSEY